MATIWSTLCALAAHLVITLMLKLVTWVIVTHALLELTAVLLPVVRALLAQLVLILLILPV